MGPVSGKGATASQGEGPGPPPPESSVSGRPPGTAQGPGVAGPSWHVASLQAVSFAGGTCSEAHLPDLPCGEQFQEMGLCPQLPRSSGGWGVSWEVTPLFEKSLTLDERGAQASSRCRRPGHQSRGGLTSQRCPMDTQPRGDPAPGSHAAQGPSGRRPAQEPWSGGRAQQAGGRPSGLTPGRPPGSSLTLTVPGCACLRAVRPFLMCKEFPRRQRRSWNVSAMVVPGSSGSVSCCRRGLASRPYPCPGSVLWRGDKGPLASGGLANPPSRRTGRRQRPMQTPGSSPPPSSLWGCI